MLQMTVMDSTASLNKATSRGKTRSEECPKLSRMVLGYEHHAPYTIHAENYMNDQLVKIKVETPESEPRSCRFAASMTENPMSLGSGSGLLHAGYDSRLDCQSPDMRFCVSPTLGLADCKQNVMKRFFDEEENDSLTSWTTKHPQNWSKKEVLDWVFYVVEQENLDGSRVKGEAYRDFNGADLTRMTSEDFQTADPVYGLKMYQTFRNLINDVIFEEPRHAPFSTTLDTFNHFNHSHTTHLAKEICNGMLCGSVGSAHAGTMMGPRSTKSVSGGFLSDNIKWSQEGCGHKNNGKTSQYSCEGRASGKQAGSKSCLADDEDDSTNSDLVIYNSGNDVQVDLPYLGVYTICTDIEFPQSSASSFMSFSSSFLQASNKLSAGASFTAPLSPLSPLSIPQFGTISSTSDWAPLSPDQQHTLTSSSTVSSSSFPSFSVPSSTSASTQWQTLSSTPTSISHCLSTSSSKSLPHSTDMFCAPTCASLNPKTSSSQCSEPHDYRPGYSSRTFPPPSTPSSVLLSTNAASYSQSQQSLFQSSSLPCSSAPTERDSSNYLPVSTPSPYATPTSKSAKKGQMGNKGAATSSTCPKSQSLSPFTYPPFDQHNNSYQASRQLSSSSTSSLSSSSSSSSTTYRSKGDSTDTGYSSEDSMSTSIPPLQQKELTSNDVCLYGDDVEMDLLCDTTEDPRKKGLKKRTTSAKTGNHLWEFVRDLLRDPKSNPKLLKWEDKPNGVFRFVQSEHVARLWGEKKNNPLMTYEKLSRAMRFCRKAGYFHQVPKNGKFPKKLCFMFGEKAHGWQD